MNLPRTAVLLALAATLLAPATSGAGVRSRQQNAGLMLVSFGESQGELVTCGCHASPKGGLARRAAIIDSLEDQETPFLHLELGDFAKLDAVSGDYETRFVWKMLEKTKVAAVSPGPRELTLWSTFRDLRDQRKIPVISSNVTVTEGRTSPVGEDYRIFDVQGLRVAVFSLLGPQALADARPPAGVVFRAADPMQTASALVPRLRSQADVVVLMSQMASSDTDRLLAAVPGIDVALYGLRPAWEPMARRVGATLCNETGARGQYVGRLALIVDPSGKIIDYGSQNVPLDNHVLEDKDVAQLVLDTQQGVADLQAAAAKKATTAADAPSGGSPAAAGSPASVTPVADAPASAPPASISPGAKDGR